MQRLNASLVASWAKENNCFSPDVRDNLYDPYIALRDAFLKSGVRLDTADVAKGPLAFELHFDAGLNSTGDAPRYLFLWETPQIHEANGDMEMLAKYRRVFTWRDDLADGGHFLKFHPPFRFAVNDTPRWRERNKLCCLISSNKSFSRATPLDLYSERVKTIRWFERNAPPDFDLYGYGWDEPRARDGKLGVLLKKIRRHLPKRKGKVYFPSYRGTVDNKFETLKKYRFSVCYENVRDLPGYITEKIFDSFSSGCVPIYWGASNVADYIPEDCFIDRKKFNNHQELYKFMVSMTEGEHQAYRERIAKYLESENAGRFSPEAFAETVVNAVMADLAGKFINSK
ncbi:MAG: hypothetical protein HY280_04290 [Nitrospinae bacterium]|nr:hypothetical protein [Nitrospinota bacterium]